MIQNELNRKPKLSFGLGVTNKTINLGDTVTLYQNTIYNFDEYELLFNFMAKDIYQFDYTPPSAGVYELQVRVVTKDLKVDMMSNKITLTVI